MADWLAGGDAPAGFTIDRDCELKAAGEEKAAVRYVRHPLDGDEIKARSRPTWPAASCRPSWR
jgi:recombination associated protein RdgC